MSTHLSLWSAPLQHEPVTHEGIASVTSAVHSPRRPRSQLTLSQPGATPGKAWSKACHVCHAFAFTPALASLTPASGQPHASLSQVFADPQSTAGIGCGCRVCQWERDQNVVSDIKARVGCPAQEMASNVIISCARAGARLTRVGVGMKFNRESSCWRVSDRRPDINCLVSGQSLTWE